MIHVKNLTTHSDFQALKKGDVVAVEWHRDAFKNKKKTRFAVYEIDDNLENMTEIILQKVMNVYFNYSMFLSPEIHGQSNLKSIALISSESV